MIHPKVRHSAIKKILNCQNGFLLIAALTLLTALTLLGTTAFILSSTDIKVGGNFRNSQMVLQVAMAGAERAREALRLENVASSNKGSLSDELNSSTRKGGNGSLNGYSTTTDDVALASGTMNGVSYSAYLSNDSADGITNTTDSNGKVMITSVATGPGNSKAQVQIGSTLNPGPSGPATIYSKGNVDGSGSALQISGNDSSSCGGSALAPVYTKDPATSNFSGNPTLTGSPSTPQHGTLDIDIQGYIDALKTGATVVTADMNNANYGSSSNFVNVYSDTNDPVNNQGLKMNGGTGYGILLVKGDLTLGGGFQWNGVIFVTGSLTMNGGGGGVNIRGQIYAGTLGVDINGGVDIGYDSCNVKSSFSAYPMKVVNWKHVY